MSLWKLIRSKQQTLAQEYLLYGLGLFIVIIITVLWLSYYNYRYFEKSRSLYLEREAITLQHVFDEKITYTEHMLQFIGTKIRENSDHSEDAIAKIVQAHRNTFKGDSFSWHMVTYTTPDGRLIADSIEGYRSHPIPIDDIKRPWLKEARTDFWKIKFSAPAHGVISDDYIIPSGIGIFDKASNKFLGFLGVGLSIDRVISNLNSFVGDNVSFIIFDKNGNFVASSVLQFESKNISLAKSELNDSQDVVHKLKDKVTIDGMVFTHLISSSKYPFKILVGQNYYYYIQQFKNDLLPKVVMYILLGTIFSAVLIFLGFRAVKPLVELGRAADAISKGKPYHLKTYDAIELNTLGQQLEKISLITKNLRVKQGMLSKVNNELQDANEFIKSNMSFLSHELINPISSIIGFAELMHNDIESKKDAELLELSDVLNKTAKYQYKQLNFFLKLFRFQEAGKRLELKEIMLKEVIEWNVSMIMHHIKKKDIRVIIDVKPGLKMLGDEIMIGQIIQNLASNAAKYNNPGGEIKIKAYSLGKKVIIDFTDTGIGVDKKDLNRIFKKFTRLVSRDKNKQIGYGLGLTYAQRCAKAHGGRITVKSKTGVGSTFTVELSKEAR